jgi:hypothetical protein
VQRFLKDLLVGSAEAQIEQASRIKQGGRRQEKDTADIEWNRNVKKGGRNHIAEPERHKYFPDRYRAGKYTRGYMGIYQQEQSHYSKTEKYIRRKKEFHILTFIRSIKQKVVPLAGT